MADDAISRGQPGTPEEQLTVSVRRAQPLRSLFRLLRPHRAGMLGAVLAFVVKDSPVWVLPPVTAAIIDIVVLGGPLERVWLWGRSRRRS
ncbi:hypothetical protein [Microbacterium suwonense]|uniref:Uncharacterized protein n=1 Tax=Microbacterium suwonense TaxID=683047 RepID=A0ABM8FR99_9MICO|nr:hypothetical protein [Microbacterium suwonense]BDZ37993.1 hypothetical protein GCM10025863_06070 [Microbacterium suwonense]